MDDGLTYHCGHRPSVSVVIPTINEAENLRHVLPRLPNWIHELVLVDGGSTDGTPDKARELWPDVRLISQQGKGQGNALRTGFAAASGDIIVMLDADGFMDPAELPVFVAALMGGADLAKGSRFLPNGGSIDFTWPRRIGAGALAKFSRLLFKTQDTDLCYGYVAFWRSTLPILALTADGFEIETELVARAHRRGLRVVEVPSFEAGRIYGASKLHAVRDGGRVLRTMIRERATSLGSVPMSQMGIQDWQDRNDQLA